MDATRFDSLARSLSLAGSRRQALAAVSGVLAALGLIHPHETWARSGTCKKPCGECEKCKKGRCKKGKCKKGRCKKGRCKKSTCRPKAAGTPCTAFAGGACQDGTCSCPSGTELCQGTCLALCAPEMPRDPSTCACCKPLDASCERGPGNGCCSGVCRGLCTFGGMRCTSDLECTSNQFDACAAGFCDEA